MNARTANRPKTAAAITTIARITIRFVVIDILFHLSLSLDIYNLPEYNQT